MKLLKRIMAGVSTVAFGLGVTNANAALTPGDTVQTDKSQTSFDIDISSDELAVRLLDEMDVEEKSYKVAARFKDRDDHGRPDLFGEPGRPAIGAPGQSGY